jgi:pre-rRNA-processing protein TSR1
MMGEQTWPTQEELREATQKKKKMPEGVSEYHRGWYEAAGLLDDAEDESGDEEDDVFDLSKKVEIEENMQDELEEEEEDIMVDSDGEELDDESKK